MPSYVKLKCIECKQHFKRLASENRRQSIRQAKIFCSIRCSSSYNGRAKRSACVILRCGHCEAKFESSTHNKAAKSFCSRSCASAGSVTDYRRRKAVVSGKLRAGNVAIGITANCLRSRESWKYVKVHNLLEAQNIDHQFEQVIGKKPYIYDLLIPSLRIAVEFDGESHQHTFAADAKKDAYALKRRWTLLRISVRPASVVSRSLFKDALAAYIKFK